MILCCQLYFEHYIDDNKPSINYIPPLQVLREGKEFEDLTEVAKLFNLYGDLEKEAETETQESTETQPM